MKRVRYPAEFKAEAVRQVTERGHGVVDVAKRLGISDKSLYLWVRLAKDGEPLRVLRRLQHLRRWSYEKVNKVFP